MGHDLLLCVVSSHYYVVHSFLCHSRFSQLIHECIYWWMGIIQEQGFFLLKLLFDLSCRLLLKWQLVKQFNYAVQLGFYSVTPVIKRIEQEINFKSKCLYFLVSLKSWITPKLDKNPTLNYAFCKV